ncbi:FAD-binding dehydrogenase [Shouchella sp. JSM 1781072]|uniref:FAD-binding dehydrogenase n=1 Tax=Bacillaceae TaxID=186817 RepID=UPI0020D178CE|nr:FAD-binding dehydrogenase [Alkalihalobacillus sp. LMS6]UTR05841.1 FAD-binding dehydrogenase [Alkalihalobacillus sp. LMS6]
MEYDAVVVGAGLSGLVVATELADKGKLVLIVDQEPETSLGGQAWWSFGGLFLVNSPEQKRLGIRDSYDLAWQDWQGSAGFDRLGSIQSEDYWGRKWAEAYVRFATYEKRQWLKTLGIRFFPVVGWAERGGSLATGHGNSVPRFHIVWGTGPGILAPFLEKFVHYRKKQQIHYAPRHRVDQLLREGKRVVGVAGHILQSSTANRGEASNREELEPFEFFARTTVVASGGIGANLDRIRQYWPSRLGEPPTNMIHGVPAHVDGRMLDITEKAGGRLVNRDRMWHYTEGIQNVEPVWHKHGIRILPGPSSIWLDANGNRFPAHDFPGYDTLSTMEAIQKTGYSYSWFILTKKIIEKEFALSGSEQNPDLTEKSVKKVLKRLLPGPPAPVQTFIDKGADFITAHSIQSLVHKMNQLGEGPFLDEHHIYQQIYARDLGLRHSTSKDAQIMGIRHARRSIGDKLVRVAKPHEILDPKNGPLIAVKLHLLSRKTLGGLQTNDSAQVLSEDGERIEGLYAVGEATGFGGGGVHGYRALEGTFLGGCLFTGKIAAEAILTQE